MRRLIDADALQRAMYHAAFETDNDMQKWDSGLWIRYKMFENCIDNIPTIEPMQWIPVKERLPEAGVSVIVTSKNGYVYTSNIAHGEWEYGGEVVAWTPLPEPWKGVRNE